MGEAGGKQIEGKKGGAAFKRKGGRRKCGGSEPREFVSPQQCRGKKPMRAGRKGENLKQACLKHTCTTRTKGRVESSIPEKKGKVELGEKKGETATVFAEDLTLLSGLEKKKKLEGEEKKRRLPLSGKEAGSTPIAGGRLFSRCSGAKRRSPGGGGKKIGENRAKRDVLALSENKQKRKKSRSLASEPKEEREPV